MIIKKLVLHNFGVYASTNEFCMSGDKPVVLIGGMNGHGKTTFLEAVLIALYGSNSSSYQESRYKTYGQYLKSYVNSYDGTQLTYIDLEFVLDSDDKDVFRIHREWSGAKLRVAEFISVYQNGDFSKFLTDNWNMFIENILPSGLSSFFFFDGEKIAALAVESTSDRMKESIKILLGISVLDTLDADLKRIEGSTNRKSTNSVNVNDVIALREIKDESAKELSDIDSKIAELEKKKNALSQELEKKQHEYATQGGDVVSKQQELFQARQAAVSKVQTIREQLLEDAASELPLALVRNLLEKVSKIALIEQEQRTIAFTLSKMETLLPEYGKSNSYNSRAAMSFIDFMRKSLQSMDKIPSYHLSDSSLARLKMLLEDHLNRGLTNIQKRQNEITHLKEEIEQYENYLSVDIDEKKIARIYKQIKEIEQEIIDIDVLLAHSIEQRRTINGKALSASHEFNRYVEAYLKSLELGDDNERVIKYTNLARSVISEYRIRLQKRKIDNVARTMTDCYKRLANKVSLIDHIEMDPISLDLHYMDNNNCDINKSSLSAGEQQLMVISLLWALALCSKQKLPVIIDTPLSRLDSHHRAALIQNYFPHASEQTIILSTDSEIDRYYYEMMKADIGDEFLLEYNDTIKATTIRRGYFKGGRP